MKPLIQDIYGVQAPPEAQATVVGHWAVTDVHKKIVVVYLTLAANDRISNEFTQAAKRVNPNLTFELIGTKIGTADFGHMALEIASKKPDAVAAVARHASRTRVPRQRPTSSTAMPRYGR